MNLKILITRLTLRIRGLLKGDKYKYSQETEANFKYMDDQDMLWWKYKSQIKQIEHAEKGKHIEEYFKEQDLTFGKDLSFQPQKTISITAGGDLNTSEVLTEDNYQYLWDDVEDFYFSGDVVCANLETPLHNKHPMSGVPVMCLTAPGLNTTPEIFEQFVRNGSGINFFSTANNHSLDMGEEGLLSTLDFLDQNGYKNKHVGTSRSRKEQQDIPIIEKNGIKIAFLAYTFGLNAYDSIPGKEYMTNLVRLNKPDTDIFLIKEHIKIAREKKADMIVAMLHWSLEFESYPIANVIHMGHRIIEAGVDIILGGHAHVAQPMETYKFIDPITKTEKRGFIIYSFGELVSYASFSKNSRLALLVKLEISKGFQQGQELTKLTDLKVLPIYTLVTRDKDGRYDYRLLDFLKLLSNLNKGNNPFSFTKAQIKELQRLEKLLNEKILPRDSSKIIYRQVS